MTCKNSHIENDLEIEDLPYYYAINIDKISANTIVQYYNHEDFEIACSGLSITGGSWSHSFDAEDLKTYIINKNEVKKTIEMQKNLISSLTNKKNELLSLNEKAAEIIEENQRKIASIENDSQNCSDFSEYTFQEVNYLENLSREPEITKLRTQLEQAYNESDALKLELDSQKVIFEADLIEAPKLAGLKITDDPYIVATIVLGIVVFILLIVLAVIRCGRQKIKKVAAIPHHHQKAGANMWVGNPKNDINAVEALDSAFSDNVFRF